MTPADTVMTFWRWFWAGVFFLAVAAALILGGWQAGWWFTAQNANREAHVIRNGYSNQQTLRDQITAQIASIADITAQIPAVTDPQEKTALKAQRKAVAAMVCGDAVQVTGDPLPASQRQWVKANCAAGSVSPSSPFFQTGS